VTLAVDDLCRTFFIGPGNWVQANLLLIVYNGDFFKAWDLVVPVRVMLHPRAKMIACLAEVLLLRITSIE